MQYIIALLMGVLAIFNYIGTQILLNRLMKQNEKKSRLYMLFIFILSFGMTIYMYYYATSSSSFYFSCVIYQLMISVFFTDLKNMVILDSALVLAFLLILGGKIFFDTPLNILYSLLHGGFCFGFLYFISFVGKKLFKRETLGFADIKLTALIGFLLPFPYFFVVLFVAAFLAIPYSFAAIKLLDFEEVPFGPFLTGGFFIVFFFLEKFQNLLALF